MRFFVGHFKGNTKEERQKKILEISLSLSLSLSWKNKHASNNERRKDDHTRIRVFFPFKKLSSCGYVRKGVWILKRPPRFRERERARDRISSLSFFSSLGICTFCISIWSEREKKVRARARFFFDFSASSDDDENRLGTD